MGAFRTILVAAVALAVGIGLGVGGSHLWRHRNDGAWENAGEVWVRLPSQTPSDPLPQTFATPDQAWAYAATTRALPPAVTDDASIVRVDLGAVSGGVGLSLAKPDGSALISKEKVLAPGPGPSSAYFRAAPGASVAVLVRNYSAPGRAGSVEVKAVRYVREAKLTKAQAAEVAKAGID